MLQLKDKESWEKSVKANSDTYGKCVVDVARKVMELLQEKTDFDASDLISEANKDLGSGITGFMAGCATNIVAKVHVRGDEFRKSWNKNYGSDSTEGTVNPAIITIES